MAESQTDSAARLDDEDNPHLCQKCREIFKKWGVPGTEFEHSYTGKHHDLDDLRASAIAGCPLCDLLFDSVLAKHDYDGLSSAAKHNIQIEIETERDGSSYLISEFESHNDLLVQARLYLTLSNRESMVLLESYCQIG